MCALFGGYLCMLWVSQLNLVLKHEKSRRPNEVRTNIEDRQARMAQRAMQIVCNVVSRSRPKQSFEITLTNDMLHFSTRPKQQRSGRPI